MRLRLSQRHRAWVLTLRGGHVTDDDGDGQAKLTAECCVAALTAAGCGSVECTAQAEPPLHAPVDVDAVVILVAQSMRLHDDAPGQRRMLEFILSCQSSRILVCVPAMPALSDFDIDDADAAPSIDHHTMSPRRSSDIMALATPPPSPPPLIHRSSSSASSRSSESTLSRSMIGSSMCSNDGSSIGRPPPIPSLELPPQDHMQSITAAPSGKTLTRGADIPPPPPDTTSSLTLVGAGPGSASLLTLAAFTAIRSATLIITDRLVQPSVLRLIPHTTPTLTANKVPGRATLAQNEINDWIVRGLTLGHRVVRLKGGDPFLFGRGAEEIIHIRATHPHAHVTAIPGVSSSLAAPLLAGIPVTHRDTANQVLIATGQSKDGSTPPLPKFDPHRTTVLLMAMSRADNVVKALMGSGAPSDIPCAVVERAGCVGQRELVCPLIEVPATVKRAGISSHAVLVVGEVVNVLRQDAKGGSGDAQDYGDQNDDFDEQRSRKMLMDMLELVV